jgi:hypothetical protein
VSAVLLTEKATISRALNGYFTRYIWGRYGSEYRQAPVYKTRRRQVWEDCSLEQAFLLPTSAMRGLQIEMSLERTNMAPLVTSLYTPSHYQADEGQILSGTLCVQVMSQWGKDVCRSNRRTLYSAGRLSRLQTSEMWRPTFQYTFTDVSEGGNFAIFIVGE